MGRRKPIDINRFWEEHWLRRRWRKITGLLAVLVVILTVRCLMLPAITAQSMEDIDVTIGTSIVDDAADTAIHEESIEGQADTDIETEQGEPVLAVLEDRVEVVEEKRHRSARLSSEQVLQGMLSESVQWRLDEQNVLTIQGIGTLPDWTLDEETPWEDWRQDIQRVVVEEGVTELGDYTLAGLNHVTEIVLPEGLTRIGKGALSGCEKLQSIRMPESLQIIEEDAFLGDEKLKTLILSRNLRSLHSLPPALKQLTMSSEQLEEVGEYINGDYTIYLEKSVSCLSTDFSKLLRHASGMEVDEDLQIQVEEGALQADWLPKSVSSVSGKVYIGSDGGIYQYDEGQQAWSLVYLSESMDTAAFDTINGERVLGKEDDSSKEQVIHILEESYSLESKEMASSLEGKLSSILANVEYAAANTLSNTEAIDSLSAWNVEYGIYHTETGQYERSPKHYIVQEGETITYRLALTNPSSESATISLSELKNQLTETRSVFAWEKGTNVQVSLSGDVSSEQTYEAVMRYSIEQSGTASEPVETLTWPEDAMLTLDAGKTAYIDIALTYPVGELFENYARKVNGRLASNKLDINQSVEIKHSMAVEAEAILQKGVLSTGVTSGYSTSGDYIDDGNRQFYVNSETDERYVIYYITLYNSGATRLYLSPIKDQLPKGVKFKNLVYGKTSTTAQVLGKNKTTTTTQEEARLGNWTNLCDEIGLDNFYRSNLSLTYGSLNNTLTCSLIDKNISRSVDRDSSKIILNEERLYLLPGTAVEFAIICSIGAETKTEDLMINTVSMDFIDYLGKGVRVSDVSFGARTDMATEGQNNGSCTFADGKLQSSVTMERQQNIEETWQINAIAKESVDESPLADVSFALYGSDASAAMAESVWQTLPSAPDRIIEEEGQTWYLYQTFTTSEDGITCFDGLTEDSYLVMEYQVPSDYMLAKPLICQKINATDGVLTLIVINSIAYEFPETGGEGTLPYVFAGLVLMAISIMIFSNRCERLKN